MVVAASGYESAQASQAGPTPFFLAKGGPSGAKGGGGGKKVTLAAVGGASQRVGPLRWLSPFFFSIWLHGGGLVLLTIVALPCFS